MVTKDLCTSRWHSLLWHAQDSQHDLRPYKCCSLVAECGLRLSKSTHCSPARGAVWYRTTRTTAAVSMRSLPAVSMLSRAVARSTCVCSFWPPSVARAQVNGGPWVDIIRPRRLGRCPSRAGVTLGPARTTASRCSRRGRWAAARSPCSAHCCIAGGCWFFARIRSRSLDKLQGRRHHSRVYSNDLNCRVALVLLSKHTYMVHQAGNALHPPRAHSLFLGSRITARGIFH